MKSVGCPDAPASATSIKTGKLPGRAALLILILMVLPDISRGGRVHCGKSCCKPLPESQVDVCRTWKLRLELTRNAGQPGRVRSRSRCRQRMKRPSRKGGTSLMLRGSVVGAPVRPPCNSHCLARGGSKERHSSTFNAAANGVNAVSCGMVQRLPFCIFTPS